MIKYSLDTPIAKLPRINEKYLRKFHKLGLNTVRDLLYHFPHRYDDFSKIVPIEKLKPKIIATIQGEILSIENTRTFKKRMVLTEALIKDKTGSVKTIWFNQPFLTKNLKAGKRVSLSGKYVMGKNGPYLSSPSYELMTLGKFTPTPKSLVWGYTHTAGLVPVYPETIGLGSRFIRYYIKLILPTANQIKEFIPFEILKRQKMPIISAALKSIHFPKTLKLAEQAKQRFAFEELFLLQLFVLKQKKKLQKENAFVIPFDKDLIQSFVKKLPFVLTNAQRKAAWEIIQDLSKNQPMNRLLQGDVGSGKTVVATMAALEVAKAGYQVAFMAPTEILAQQHFKELSRLLKGFKIKIGLLTSSANKIGNKTIKRTEFLKKIQDGQIDILIGTHALIQEKVKFSTEGGSAHERSEMGGKNLALVIVDEQHRFGVEQRAKLVHETTYIPHLLSMTATPIPRTLALTIYGDLDISLLDEMPKGRQKIITKVIPPSEREQAYEFIRREVKKGRQVFVICPRIEPSTDKRLTLDDTGSDERQTRIDVRKLLWAEVKAVKEEYEKLNEKVFPDLKIAMLHGKMPSKKPAHAARWRSGSAHSQSEMSGKKTKEEVMNDFRTGKYDVLVSTSVVEVGIDIPNATVMMIEGADRFGLAQLHQFRGRVGRGRHQSYCFLFSTSGDTTARLRALQKCENGFELAEKDLQIRGPGQFYGVRQSGLPDLAMDSLKDLNLIKTVRSEALELLKKDPDLRSCPLLATKLTQFKQTIHLE